MHTVVGGRFLYPAGDTEAYAKAMCKRKVWIEPLFAEAKLAWLATLPIAWAREGQHPGSVHCGRPKFQTAPQQTRVVVRTMAK